MRRGPGRAPAAGGDAGAAGWGLLGAGPAGASEHRPRREGRGCQREIWSASNHLLRELRLHLPSLFFPRRGFALPQSWLLGFGLMVWLRLFGFLKNVLLFFLSLLFAPGREGRRRSGGSGPGVAPRATGSSALSRLRAVPRGTQHPWKPEGAGGIRGNGTGTVGAFPVSEHPSVRPGSPPGCLRGRLLCRSRAVIENIYCLFSLPEN